MCFDMVVNLEWLMQALQDVLHALSRGVKVRTILMFTKEAVGNFGRAHRGLLACVGLVFINQHSSSPKFSHGSTPLLIRATLAERALLANTNLQSTSLVAEGREPSSSEDSNKKQKN